MNDYTEFKRECAAEIETLSSNASFVDLSRAWLIEAQGYRYSYHFEHLGRPIIQYPQDIVAMQELIWKVKPDLIVETGIAHGGSLILSASMLALLDYCDAVESGHMLDPAKPQRRVLGVDIDIRSHNRAAIEAHPMANRIDMLQGSSIAPEIIKQVYEKVGHQRPPKVMVSLDSNHTHDHVLAELKAYAPLVTPGSYCIVFDTVIEDFEKGAFPDRPWDKGNNPKTAVWAFLENNDGFEIDRSIQNKIQITVAPDGYLLKR